MNKQGNNIVGIKYIPGKWFRDALGSYFTIKRMDREGKYVIKYIGSYVEIHESEEDIRKNYVPSVFQQGDKVIFNNRVVEIIGLFLYSPNEYYYKVLYDTIIYGEPVKDIDATGEFTKN